MNRYYNLLITAALALAMAACQSDNGQAELAHHHHEHDHGHEHEHAEAHDHAAHSHAEGEDHDHGHAEVAKPAHGEIELEPAVAKQFGVEVQQVEPGDFSEVIAVSGQIVDTPTSASVVTAPTSGIVKFLPGITLGRDVANGTAVATISASGITGGSADEAARVAYAAALREVERITPLYKQGIVSKKEYNEATQALALAKAAYSPAASSGRATAPGSGVITQLIVTDGQYVNAGDPIAAVSSNRHLTLRADVPERLHRAIPGIASANIELPYEQGVIRLADLNGHRASQSATVSAQRGYAPVYFTFDNNGAVLPGSLVKAYLIGKKRAGVIAVPVSAISEQQGAKFVYEQLDDECYRKVPVTLGANDGERVEVVAGLNGGENIVTKGVVAVRLAETSAVAPEGHSHNH